MRISIAVATGLALAGLSMPAYPQEAPTWEAVSAIFEARCTMCHSGDGPPLGLSLETHETAMAGSENGPVLVAGAPDESELMARILGESMPQMPLNGEPLGEDEIALIRAWIEAGLPGPAM